MVALYTQHFGGPEIDTHDQWLDTRVLPGLVAEQAGERMGVLSHTPMAAGVECEVVALSAATPGMGAGTALLLACVEAAEAAGCRRVFLTTSNDNTPALRFYQQRGWRIARVDRDAITRARRKKPTIPQYGIDGILVADEIELEWVV